MRWQRSLHHCGRIANWSLHARLLNHPARLPGKISAHTHGTNCAAWPEERALKKQHVVVRVPLRLLMPAMSEADFYDFADMPLPDIVRDLHIKQTLEITRIEAPPFQTVLPDF